MPTVDDYLAALPDDRRETAQALRAAILSADPDARESIKWGQPVFDVNGPIVALKAHTRHVTLTFWRGAALDDPDGILDGEGDRMRHARFTSADAVPTATVQALVRQAVALNRELGDPTTRR